MNCKKCNPKGEKRYCKINEWSEHYWKQHNLKSDYNKKKKNWNTLARKRTGFENAIERYPRKIKCNK